MTDLEITKFCAEAIGIKEISKIECGIRVIFYDPLHDDAQAMALVKKLGITINLGNGIWYAKIWFETEADSADLNRAICECVAKMQSAK